MSARVVRSLSNAELYENFSSFSLSVQTHKWHTALKISEKMRTERETGNDHSLELRSVCDATLRIAKSNKPALF